MTEGHELPLRLLAGFRAMIDELHAELAKCGHPDLRPMHGFVFQAIGTEGTTAVALGRALGVTKQAAGKTVDTLEKLGYVERTGHPGDARRKLICLTPKGTDALRQSARIFGEQREAWKARLGQARLHALEADLRELTPSDYFRLDAPGWLG